MTPRDHPQESLAQKGSYKKRRCWERPALSSSSPNVALRRREESPLWGILFWFLDPLPMMGNYQMLKSKDDQNTPEKTLGFWLGFWVKRKSLSVNKPPTVIHRPPGAFPLCVWLGQEYPGIQGTWSHSRGCGSPHCTWYRCAGIYIVPRLSRATHDLPHKLTFADAHLSPLLTDFLFCSTKEAQVKGWEKVGALPPAELYLLLKFRPYQAPRYSVAHSSSVQNLLLPFAPSDTGGMKTPGCLHPFLPTPGQGSMPPCSALLGPCPQLWAILYQILLCYFTLECQLSPARHMTGN
jgi:hypothetical protein